MEFNKSIFVLSIYLYSRASYIIASVFAACNKKTNRTNLVLVPICLFLLLTI